MARKELKMINRRLQRGRIRSIEEGNYISPNPPYGYLIDEGKNYRTLKPHPEQAEVVKMIFEWYTQGLGGGMSSHCGYFQHFQGRPSTIDNLLRVIHYLAYVIYNKKNRAIMTLLTV